MRRQMNDETKSIVSTKWNNRIKIHETMFVWVALAALQSLSMCKAAK